MRTKYVVLVATLVVCALALAAVPGAGVPVAAGSDQPVLPGMPHSAADGLMDASKPPRPGMAGPAIPAGVGAPPSPASALGALDDVWEDPVQVTGDASVSHSTPTSASQRDIVVASNGVVHCVWTGSKDGVSFVGYNRYYPGSGWTEDYYFAGTTFGTSKPSIALDSNGTTIHVVYEALYNGNYHVFYMKCEPTETGNGGWDPTFTDLCTYHPTSPTAYSFFPVVACAPGNKVAVTWQWYTSSRTFALAFRECIGGTWGSQELLDPDDLGKFTPSIAYDRSGNVYISYYGHYGVFMPDYHPWVKRRIAGIWQTTEDAGSDLLNCNIVSIAVDPTTVYPHVCFFGQGADGYYRIYHNWRGVDGWQPTSDIVSGMATDRWENCANCFFTPDGRLEVVWMSFPNYPNQYGIKHNEWVDGDWATSDGVLIANLPDGHCFYPNVTVDNYSRGIYAVWTQMDYWGTYHVWMRRARPPDAPVLVSPVSDAFDEPTDGTLTWDAADRATGYDVCLDVTDPPTTPSSENQTGTSYAYTGLLNEQTYYWRVVAKNWVGQAASDVWHFTTIPAAGWTRRASMVGAPAEGAGGWLAYNPVDGLIYAARGEGTGDFYSYDQKSNQWTSLTPIPGFQQGNKLILPSYGCRGVVDDHGDIYMTLGNMTNKFLRYSAGTWTYLPDNVPSAKISKGTDAVFANGCVYLLDGSNSKFYKYDPSAVSPWSDLGGPRAGGVLGWVEGSWFVFDGSRTLYAHRKARNNPPYNEMWAFDLVSQTWGSSALPGMTGSAVGAGSGAAWFNNSVRALTGNNTVDFWRYVPADNAWYSLPSIGGKVGVGGDMTATPNKLFAFRGSKSNELWRYVPDPVTGLHAGVGSAPTSPVKLSSIDVLPNPASGRFAVVQYALPQVGPLTFSLLDVSGRVVRTEQVPATRRTGTLSIDLGGLNAGVYLVRITSADLTTTRKLVVQR